MEKEFKLPEWDLSAEGFYDVCKVSPERKEFLQEASLKDFADLFKSSGKTEFTAGDILRVMTQRCENELELIYMTFSAGGFYSTIV